MEEEIIEKNSRPVFCVKDLSVCISVSDLDTSIQWYSAVLGFKVVVRLDFPGLASKIAFLEVNGFKIELVQSANFIADKRPGPPAHTDRQGVTQLSFRVDDIEAVMAEVKRRDLPVCWDIVTVQPLHMKAALLRDNDGNLIELIEEIKE